jgi:hypothetical protein
MLGLGTASLRRILKPPGDDVLLLYASHESMALDLEVQEAL